VLLPLPRRGRDRRREPRRTGSALGGERHAGELPARQLCLHGVDRPAREGNAGVERAAGLFGDPGAVPVREGPERRLAQAGTPAPARRLAKEGRPRAVTPGDRRIRWAALTAAAVSAAPWPAASQDRLDRDQVLAIL